MAGNLIVPFGKEILKDIFKDAVKDALKDAFTSSDPGYNVDLVKGIQELQKSIDLLANTLNIIPSKNLPNVPFGYFDPKIFLSTLVKQFHEFEAYVKPGMEFANKFYEGLEVWKKLSEEQREAFRNFGSAFKGLIEGTFTVKDGFNVADRATRIKRQAEFMGEDGQALLHLVNLLHRYGFNDAQSLGMARKMGEVSNKATSEKGQQELQKSKDYEGLRFFAQYNPEILKAGHSSFERLNMLIEAYAKALMDKNVNFADLQQLATQAFGGEAAPLMFKVARDALDDPLTHKNLYHEKREQERKRSQEEVGDLDANENIDDVKKGEEVAKLQTGLGANAVMEPFLVPFLEFITDFMNKHHEGISTFEGYGAMGLELYKFGNFAYTFSDALNALHSKKNDDNIDGSDIERGKPPRGSVPQEIYSPPYPKSAAVAPKTDEQHEQLPWYQFPLPLAAMLLGLQMANSIKKQGDSGAISPSSPQHIPLPLPSVKVVPINYKSQDGIIGGRGSSQLPLIDHGVYYPNRDRVQTIPLAGKDGSTWRTLSNRRPFAGDMAQANQHEKLLQTINNNQQFHTVINVTPSNSDPMQVAQLVYQKFQHATFNGNKAEPSKKSTQRGQAIWA